MVSISPTNAAGVASDGVIDYPLYEGQPLTGVWAVTPSPNGPSVASADGYLHYWVNQQPGYNQGLLAAIITPLPTTNGLVVSFDIRANTIEGDEVKFQVWRPHGLTLRFQTNGSQVAWQWWGSGRFETLATSSVRADGTWRRITMVYAPNQVTIFEDGVYRFTWNRGIGSTVTPAFDMQVLTQGANLSFDVGNVLASPATFADGVGTPWDYAFEKHVTPPSEAIGVRYAENGIPVSFHHGFVRFETPALQTANAWSVLDVRQQAPPVAVIAYRLRVNASGGSETKVTLPGDNILRLTDDGKASSWNSYDRGRFDQLAPSGIVAGQAAFTIVTLVVNATSLTLFENGVFKFKRTYSSAAPSWPAGVAVQHLDPQTPVSVDVGGIRTLPSIKSQPLLAIDLQPELLAYYPLKGDLDAAAGGAPSLTPIGRGQPAFGPGKFGNAATFGQTGAPLTVPPLSLATSPSYTVSAWVKVNSYPPAGQSAGIAGSIQLSPDGRIDYRFIYVGDGIARGAVFASRNPLTTGVWHSIAVTYSYDEARLMIYVDGAVDTVKYLGADVARAGALVPAVGYVGGAQASYNSAVVALNGSVGDVMFLSQHIHQATARMLAALDAAEDESGLAVIPVFIVIAAVAVGVIIQILRQSGPKPPPSVAEVAKLIQDKADRPARDDARVTRAEIEIDDKYPIKLDIGGEGRLRVGGLVTGFSDAINVNAVLRGDGIPTVTVDDGKLKGSPIPNLVYLRAWENEPAYPFADSFADKIVMIGAELPEYEVLEMARVIKPGGEINLWIWDGYLPRVQWLARLLNSVVEEPPELPEFAGNGSPRGTWFTRRRIVSHKPPTANGSGRTGPTGTLRS